METGNNQSRVVPPDRKAASHPLRMMASDYASVIRHQAPDQSAPARQPFHQHRGTGERDSFNRPQRNFKRPDSRSGSVEDFILPEMFVDPWLELYGRLSDDVRHRETRHLSDSEKQRVEEIASHLQSAKRRSTLDVSNS